MSASIVGDVWSVKVGCPKAKLLLLVAANAASEDRVCMLSLSDFKHRCEMTKGEVIKAIDRLVTLGVVTARGGLVLSMVINRVGGAQ